MTNPRSWKAGAKRRWGKKAAWIHGDGPYAVLAPCRELTVTPWTSRDKAEEAKDLIDKGACGGFCNPALHKIIDLSK